MKNLILIPLYLLTSFNGWASKGPFFGVVPDETPRLLAPNLIMSPFTEYNGAFNPAGTEFYYTISIPGKIQGFQGIIAYTQLKKDGTWSPPLIAPFSGEYSDYDPIFSPDGSKLYYSSRRPLPNKPESIQNNVWFVERNDHGWGQPQLIKLTDKGNTYNSLTRSGTLYFNTWSTGEMLTADKKKDGTYEIKTLPFPVNSEGNYDGDPFVSPEGDYLIFRRDRGQGTLGKGDLFITFNIKGVWTDPENLGEPINSKDHEMCPSVTPDGKIFIFSSNRKYADYQLNPNTPVIDIIDKYKSADNGRENIYYMSTGFIEKFRQRHIRQ
ncbi:TolB family protein [Marinicella sp. W31]|uniref:TolB family protein n=1 Tax=Marinicella sp. W31 TaxID=3023713 RepID=UPI003757AC60